MTGLALTAVALVLAAGAIFLGPASLAAADGPVAFSRPVPALFPDAPYLTCEIGHFAEPSRAHNWKLYLRDAGLWNVDLLVVASAAHPEENGAIRATVRDESGPKSVTVPYPTSGDSQEKLTLALMGGKVYGLAVERLEPATGPAAHRYKLGASDRRLEIGWADPLSYLEPASQAWVVHADAGETVRVQLFTDHVRTQTLGRATKVTALVRQMNREPVSPLTTYTAFPTTLSVPDSPGETLVVRVRADGHFMMRKASGSDLGFYALPCADSLGTAPICVTQVRNIAHVVGKGAQYTRAPLSKVKAMMLGETAVRERVPNPTEAEAVWAAFGNAPPEAVYITDASGAVRTTARADDRSGWIIYLDAGGSLVQERPVTSGVTNVAAPNRDCRSDRGLEWIGTVKPDGSLHLMPARHQQVSGSLLTITYPREAVWQAASQLYPFIFRSDASWDVSVCAEVPPGHSVTGVYDAAGNLVSTGTCAGAKGGREDVVLSFEALQGDAAAAPLKAVARVRGPDGVARTVELQVPVQRASSPGSAGPAGALSSWTLHPATGLAVLVAIALLGTLVWARARTSAAVVNATVLDAVGGQPAEVLDSASNGESQPLTARELEVATLLAEGLSNRQIAAQLVISEGTAKRHVENILQKLGLKSRSQVVAWAGQYGGSPSEPLSSS